MENLRNGSHSVQQLHVHIVWGTKYRYKVLEGDIQLRCRDLIRQSCDVLDVQILKGVVSKDHIHLHLSYILEGLSRKSFIVHRRSLIENLSRGAYPSKNPLRVPRASLFYLPAP